MAAPTLPRGITGPTSFSLATSGRDARWLEVRGSRVKSCRCSAAEFASTLNTVVGTAAPGVRNLRLNVATMQALRLALQRAGATAAAAEVRDNELTREAIRGAIWLCWVRGTADEGTPATRIWLPNGALTVPAIPGTVPDGDPGMWCDVLEPTAAPSPTPTGGGSTPTTPTPSPTPTGGGSTPTPSPGGVVTAGVGLGTLAVAAGGFAVLAAYALTSTKEGKRAARQAVRRVSGGASVMRARLAGRR